MKIFKASLGFPKSYTFLYIYVSHKDTLPNLKGISVYLCEQSFSFNHITKMQKNFLIALITKIQILSSLEFLSLIYYFCLCKAKATLTSMLAKKKSLLKYL